MGVGNSTFKGKTENHDDKMEEMSKPGCSSSSPDPLSLGAFPLPTSNKTTSTVHSEQSKTFFDYEYSPCTNRYRLVRKHYQNNRVRQSVTKTKDHTKNEFIFDRVKMTSRRRSVTKVNYDMKHHPMDDIMRPGVVARRRRMSEGVAAAVLDDEDSDDEADKGSEEGASSSLEGGSFHSTQEWVDAPSTKEKRRSGRVRVSDDTTSKYNQSWHPIDEVIPTGEDTVGEESQTESGTESSTEDGEDKEVEVEGNQEEEQMDLPATRAGQVSPACVQEEDNGHQDRRRSSRVANNGSVLKYDAHHHPMDEHMRPKQVAKRVQVKARLSKGTQQVKSSTQQQPTSKPDIQALRTEVEANVTEPLDVPDSPSLPVSTQSTFGIPELPPKNNPYLRERVLQWNSLSEFDQYLYVLQKGAPISEGSLPLSWDAVKHQLFENGFVTLDFLNSPEGTVFCVDRYQKIRAGLRAFFGGEEEPESKEQWLLYYDEDFDVFHVKPGDRYWKLRDQIARPITTGLPPMPTVSDDGVTVSPPGKDASFTATDPDDQVGSLDKTPRCESPTTSEEGIVQSMQTRDNITTGSSPHGDSIWEIENVFNETPPPDKTPCKPLVDHKLKAPIPIFIIDSSPTKSTSSSSEPPRSPQYSSAHAVVVPSQQQSPQQQRKRKRGHKFQIFEDEENEDEEEDVSMSNIALPAAAYSSFTFTPINKLAVRQTAELSSSSSPVRRPPSKTQTPGSSTMPTTPGSGQHRILSDYSRRMNGRRVRFDQLEEE